MRRVLFLLVIFAMPAAAQVCNTGQVLLKNDGAASINVL